MISFLYTEKQVEVYYILFHSALLKVQWLLTADLHFMNYSNTKVAAFSKQQPTKWSERRDAKEHVKACRAAALNFSSSVDQTVAVAWKVAWRRGQGEGSAQVVGACAHACKQLICTSGRLAHPPFMQIEICYSLLIPCRAQGL